MATKRLFYIDAFRGLAVLLMVFLNIFDYISTYDVHVDVPFYISSINSVTYFPPILLFCFVGGMSGILLCTKLKCRTKNRLEFIKSVIKRYGKYFVISIPFTLFMWGFSTFYAWEEAIQGLSISAIITSIILYFFKSKKKLILIAFALFALQSLLLFSWRDLAWTSSIAFRDNYSIQGFLLNMIFRGWFSILNLVPIMLCGAFFFQNFVEKKVKANLIVTLASTIIMILLWNIIPVNYYMRSFTLILYTISICGTTTILIYYLYSKGLKSNLLKTLGVLSFEIYILHFLLSKLIRLFGYGDILNMFSGSAITIVIISLIYIGAKFYVKKYKPRLA